MSPGPKTATATWGGDANHYGNSGTGNFVIGTWTRYGFYQPVDMGGVYNVVKGGSTVPLRRALATARSARTTSR